MKSQKSKQRQALNKGGRPLFDGKSEKLTRSKLCSAWDIGATDEEACISAGISVAALKRYCQKHPEFRAEKTRRKQASILKARKTLYENLGNVETAKWYLERKCKEEFSKLSKELIGQDPEHQFTSFAETLQSALKKRAQLSG